MHMVCQEGFHASGYAQSGGIIHGIFPCHSARRQNSKIVNKLGLSFSKWVCYNDTSNVMPLALLT